MQMSQRVMVDGRVDSVMMLKVLRQVVEILQGLHVAGITLAVTYRNVKVDLSRGSLAPGNTHEPGAGQQRHRGRQHLGCRSFITSCEARGVDMVPTVRRWAGMRTRTSVCYTVYVVLGSWRQLEVPSGQR